MLLCCLLITVTHRRKKGEKLLQLLTLFSPVWCSEHPLLLSPVKGEDCHETGESNSSVLWQISPDRDEMG